MSATLEIMVPPGYAAIADDFAEAGVKMVAGDTKVLWDPTVKAERKAVARLFDRLRGKGFMAYQVDDIGQRGEVIRELDPEAGRVIMTPPMQGG